MYRGRRVSVVLPCHNEEALLPQTLQSLPAWVDEVVVVDNNSRDRTAELARAHGALVIEERRQGYGAALRAGFARATGDYIVAMDGDGTYPGAAIPVLLDAAIEGRLDFVSGDRTAAAPVGYALRALGNRLLSAVQRALYRVQIRDSQSGMWVLRRAALPLLRLTADGMAFSEEIKIEAFTHPALRARELPIDYCPRRGPSKLCIWRDGPYNLLFLFRKRLPQLRRRPCPWPALGQPKEE